RGRRQARRHWRDQPGDRAAGAGQRHLRGERQAPALDAALAPRTEVRMIEVTVNGKTHALDVEPDAPLLWVLRESLGLTGTKFGCGIAACGACTVLVDGEAVRSCSFPVSAATGKLITTIEGLSSDRSHPLQKAWIAEQVPQCGYCQSGMIMSAAALLEAHPRPTERQIAEAMTNLCRCGTYHRVRKAIRRASGQSA